MSSLSSHSCIWVVLDSSSSSSPKHGFKSAMLIYGTNPKIYRKIKLICILINSLQHLKWSISSMRQFRFSRITSSRWFRKEGKKVELDTFSSQLSKGANIAICLVYVTRLKVTINSCIINKPIYSFSTYILIISKLLFSFLLGFIHEKDIIISFHRSRHLVLAMKLKTWI